MHNRELSICYAIGILITLIALPGKLLLTTAKAAPPILRVGMELS